jgi:hypothetical protein
MAEKIPKVNHSDAPWALPLVSKPDSKFCGDHKQEIA